MESEPNSTYGLFPLGYRYEVKEPFEIEILAGYNEKDHQKMEPSWEKIKTIPGDLIGVTKDRAYLYPSETEGFVECRPVQSESSSVWNRLGSEETLEKLGKTPSGSRPLPMEERKKLSLSRGI